MMMFAVIACDGSMPMSKLAAATASSVATAAPATCW